MTLTQLIVPWDQLNHPRPPLYHGARDTDLQCTIAHMFKADQHVRMCTQLKPCLSIVIGDPLRHAIHGDGYIRNGMRIQAVHHKHHPLTRLCEYASLADQHREGDQQEMKDHGPHPHPMEDAAVDRNT